MTTLRIKALLGAGCMSLATIGSANAGGFSRGSADTDIQHALERYLCDADS